MTEDDFNLETFDDLAELAEQQRKIYQEYIERIVEESEVNPNHRIYVHFDKDDEDGFTVNNNFPYYPTERVMEYEAEVDEDGIVSLVRARTVQTAEPEEDTYGEWMEV